MVCGSPLSSPPELLDGPGLPPCLDSLLQCGPPRGLRTLVMLGQGAEHSLTALAAWGPQQLLRHPNEVPPGLLIRLDYLHNPLHPKAPRLLLNEEQ